MLCLRSVITVVYVNQIMAHEIKELRNLKKTKPAHGDTCTQRLKKKYPIDLVNCKQHDLCKSVHQKPAINWQSVLLLNRRSERKWMDGIGSKLEKEEYR